MNSARFLADHPTYFTGAYDGFRGFGGPCIHFHQECLSAGEREFLSSRHIEMLYATLTAWGMHRMGEGKTKLVGWEAFRDSLRACAAVVNPMRNLRMLDLSEAEYADVISQLSGCYHALRLSMSDATVVMNSKALFHLLPHLIPPIDRQYTLRFFKLPPEKWRTAKKGFTQISVPTGREKQFELFGSIFIRMKRLSDQVDRSLFDEEFRQWGVTAPKAIDNAIVRYVRVVGKLPDDEPGEPNIL